MSEQIHLTVTFSASARQVYEAWLDSAAHAQFTGSPAEIDPKLGGKFTAWDNYISGQNLELEPNSRILQSWRTTEFPKDAQNSLLEVLLEENGKNTQLTLIHTQIPDGQADQYAKGWRDYYFTPMAEYFSG
jgi:activator of HSP90 ATPase